MAFNPNQWEQYQDAYASGDTVEFTPKYRNPKTGEVMSVEDFRNKKTDWMVDDRVKKALEAANPQAAQSTTTKAGDFGGTSVTANIQYDEDGKPIAKDYTSIMDKDGKLKDQFSIAGKVGDDIKLNTQGLDEIRKRALATGPSAWANMALQKQGLEQTNAMNDSARNNAAQSNAAYNRMRMSGGLSAGARERMARDAARGMASSKQGILNQGMMQRANIGLQDQQMKDDYLKALPGMDMAKANFDQGQRAYRLDAEKFDLGNKLRDLAGLNIFKSGVFDKEMQGWAAGKTADAQSAASSGGKK